MNWDTNRKLYCSRKYCTQTYSMLHITDNATNNLLAHCKSKFLQTVQTLIEKRNIAKYKYMPILGYFVSTMFPLWFCNYYSMLTINPTTLTVKLGNFRWRRNLRSDDVPPYTSITNIPPLFESALHTCRKYKTKSFRLCRQQQL